MSFGSLSKEAHETLATAMNTLGGRSNTGEGGEDSKRFKTITMSATKQVASGRFGVTAEYLVNAKEIQIKMAQGAKPGEGGRLPGPKVNEKIGKVRHAIPGIDLISPPPHHDIYSIEDLEQLIHDLKSVNPKANISVKLVSEVGVGTVAAGVAKAKADLILISGYDGGTGAAPYTSIKYTGGPWELGLSEAHQVLLMNNLRSRVILQTDGQMRTGKDVVVAALLGAEEFGFATTPLVVMGCMMMRKCHSNTCPMGVATQNPELRKKFKGKVEHVINYFTFVATEVREIMAELGFRTMDEMIGRVDKLEINKLLKNEKTKDLDFSSILYRPNLPQRIVGRKIINQDHGIDTAYDLKLIEFAKPSLENKPKVTGDFKIKNINRTVGTMLSGKIAKRYGAEGLPDDTITLNLTGSTGQSFMAFGMKGITINLTGDCIDYVGKGLSGATAVVEGVGDHGCEYMTGGTVVILGDIGRNFAAGMSGGKVFVYDPDKQLKGKLNHGIVNSADIEKLIDTEDEVILRNLIEKHFEYTESKKSKMILDNWDKEKFNIVRVIPKMYKKLISEYQAV